MRSLGYYVKNDSGDNFCFENGRCIDYSSFILGELKASKDKKMPITLSLKESRYPIGYKNKKNVFSQYIKDSVAIKELFYDENYSISNLSNLNELMLTMYSNDDLNTPLKCSPNKYYNGDTSQYEKILNNVIPIYLPPNFLFAKREVNQYNNPVSIEESFPNATEIVIYQKGKSVYKIDMKNIRKIMKKDRFNGESGSYILEITDNNKSK